MIYLDHAATTPVHPEVERVMRACLMRQFYNPSSAYYGGLQMRQAIEEVRELISDSIHVLPEEIYFTSGGTEADNWVLLNAVEQFDGPVPHIITSNIEHHAILHTCAWLQTKGCRITELPVDGNGLLHPSELEAAITPDTCLISIMMANNEIGTIQPIRECSVIAKRYGIPFHSDTVQTYGHLEIDAAKDGLDYMSVSAHKFGGPKGVGFLYATRKYPLLPFLHGGAQERGKRAGTENTSGILGMGRAVELAGQRRVKRAQKEQFLRERLKNNILSGIEGTSLNGDPTKRLPGNLNICFQGVESASLIAMLAIKGIYVSGGSACTAAQKEPSHVLKAIGRSDEEARGSIRITIGYENTVEEMDYVYQVIKAVVEQLRGIE